MSDQVPLEIQVAKILGWTDIQWTIAQGAWGRDPSGKGGQDGKGYGRIPRYGMDTPDGWAVTGPFVSKYGFSVLRENPNWWEVSIWSEGFTHFMYAEAASPVEAIARLVVKLAEMGRLKV